MKAMSVTLLVISLCCSQLANAFNTARSSPAKIMSSVLTMHNRDENDATDTSRRSIFASALSAYVSITLPLSANAVYGADANMQFPNVAQGIADRTNKQCLVESLGNRECLVYEDPDNKLYKSADSTVLFERLGKSIDAFDTLPSYITNKQWSNVQSVLTGPMGSLSYNLNEIVKLIDEDTPKKNKCRDLTVKIRTDLYGISGATSTKDVKQALSNYEKAKEKLGIFVKLVSSA